MSRFFLVSLFLILAACVDFSSNKGQIVNNAAELNEAIKLAKPGDEIILANGIWKDMAILFTGKGSEEKPIILRAETAGKVIVEGRSFLKFGGEYLTVSGLYFKTDIRQPKRLSNSESTKNILLTIAG